MTIGVCHRVRPIGGSRVPVCKAAVVLTRQSGSNDRAKAALERYGVDSIELPLITFRTRSEAASLADLIGEKSFDWITLTSPQASRVFRGIWREAGCPFVRVATFEASKMELDGTEIEIGFVPEIATGEELARTLPMIGKGEVLYPASSKADDKIESMLTQRSFTVTRVNTYDTTAISRSEVDSEDLRSALAADVLTFASPTAVKAWIDVADKDIDWTTHVACIGKTTAAAASKKGFQNVTFADRPGLDGLIAAVVEILKQKGKLD